jgi:hypothetical protein
MEESEEPQVGTILVLEYPNQRTIERTVPVVVTVGYQFAMHGRRWQAVEELEDWRPRRGLPARLLCRSLGASTIAVIDDPRRSVLKSRSK